MKRRIILPIVIFVIMGSAVAYVVFNFDFGKLLDLKWSSIAAGCIFLSVSLFLYALSSKILLNGLGFRRKFIDILAVNLISQVATISISSKIDIPAKVYLNKKVLDLPYPVGLVLVTLRVFLQVLVTAVLAGALLLIIPSARLMIPPVVPGGIIMILITLYLLIVKIDLNQLYRKRPRFVGKALAFAGDAHRALKGLPQKDVISTGIVLSANIAVIGLYLFFLYLQYDYHPNLGMILFAYSISVLAGFFSMVPLGIGVMEAGFILLMNRFGYPPEASSTIILVKRAVWTFIPVILGIAVLMRKGISLIPIVKKRRAENNIGTAGELKPPIRNTK